MLSNRVFIQAAVFVDMLPVFKFRIFAFLLGSADKNMMWNMNVLFKDKYVE